MENTKPRLVLIDGYGFVFRAYHSMPPLTRSDGTPVGAVLGFTNMLLKMLEKYRNEHIAVIFDAGEKNFRNDLYSEYKANRPPAPEDLKPQFPLVRDAAEALSLPVIDKAGFEADDIIATYTQRAKAQGYCVTIVSSDKDLMQLVEDPFVQMFDPMKSKNIGEEEVEAKFGVRPPQLLDVLALMGDSADNVPGVPGIGPKTAAELIQRYGNLEVLLESTDEIKQPKRRQTLQDNRDEAQLSKTLIRLDNDVELPMSVDELTVRNFDNERFVAFLEAQNFRTLVQRFKVSDNAAPTAQKKKPTEINYAFTAIDSIANLSQWLAQAGELTHLYLQPLYDKKLTLKGMAVGDNNTRIGYISFDSQSAPLQESLFDFQGGTASTPTMVEQLSKAIRPYLKDPAVTLVAYDIKQLMALGIRAESYDDLMLMSYLLGAGKHSHTLAETAHYYLEKDLPKYIDDSNQSVMASIAGPLIELHTLLQREIFEHHLCTIYQRIEKPLISVLEKMERNGIAVRPELLKQLSSGFAQQLTELEAEILTLAGVEFNIASPKQLGAVLFETLQLPGGKQSKKTGAYATGADVLEELAAEGYAIADKVLQWRQLAKLKTTYTDALLQDIAPDGRIHSHFSMAATSTGRLSSYDPNLQNIPVRSEQGNKIREAFVAEPGKRLISADYSQIELRLLAHVADIETLKSAFSEGRDIHRVTASEMFGIEEADVDSSARRQAKMINFGIIYGISAFGLAHRLGISRSDAKEYIERYFTQYPGIRRYMDETIATARTQGWVQTIFGRLCHIPAINDRNPARRQFSERAAINAPLQGAAADIIKKAMLRVPMVLQQHKLDARMILQVHDELLFEVPEAQAEQAAQLIQSTMEQVVSLSVPLDVSVGIGNNWSEIH